MSNVIFTSTPLWFETPAFRPEQPAPRPEGRGIIAGLMYGRGRKPLPHIHSAWAKGPCTIIALVLGYKFQVTCNLKLMFFNGLAAKFAVEPRLNSAGRGRKRFFAIVSVIWHLGYLSVGSVDAS
jgi:hypothetical protein